MESNKKRPKGKSRRERWVKTWKQKEKDPQREKALNAPKIKKLSDEKYIHEKEKALNAPKIKKVSAEK